MKVGFKTESENQFKSLNIDNIKASPVLVSLVQNKDNNMDIINNPVFENIELRVIH